jgi:hypothetical protein
MVGTALRLPLLGLAADVRRARAGAGVSDGRGLLTALILLAFVMGAIFGPTAHAWFDGDANPASVQMLDAPDRADTPDAPGAPGKAKIAGLCAGHCASHAVSLPAPLAVIATPFVLKTDWHVADDQWSQASGPARLERPPRV